jgi:hypothetical protein
VVTTDDEVCSTVVLADNSVPDGLAGTSHTHSKRQKSQDGHAVGVAGHEGLVDTDTGEVVNVTGLGQANDGVDEDVGLAGAGSADRQLTVSAVHGVPGLESDDLGPAKLVKVQTQFGGRVPETDIVVVLQAVDGLELTADVVLVDSLVEVLDGGVGHVAVLVEDFPRLLLLVWLVYIVDGDDGEVAVVAEVAKGNASSLLDTDFIDCLFRDIERDGDGEEVAVGETVFGNDTVVVLLVHETCMVACQGSCCCKHGKHEGVAFPCPSPSAGGMTTYPPRVKNLRLG